MKKTLLLFALALAFSMDANAQANNYTVGETVDDFTITDVHGQTHNLSSIAASGKWIILDFFFTTCGPCQIAVPYFSQLHQKYGCNAGDLYCISVDNGDTDAEVIDFETTYAAVGGFSPAPSVSGIEGGGNAVVSNFGVNAFPTFCLIGSDMKMKDVDIWPVSSVGQFEAAFAALGFSPAVMNCLASLDDLSTNASMNIFPNPAKNATTIQISLNSNSEVVANVYNMVGAIVATEKFIGISGDNQWVLNTNNFENGLYILSLELGNGKQVKSNLTVLK